MIRFVLLGVLLCSISKADSVVLFIADGLGTAWVTAARKEQGQKLWLDKLPHTALVITEAADNVVTDSAASATAIATGKKTNVGMLGMDPTGKSLKSLAELAKQKGKQVGFVTTTSITHATPAAFYAHLKDRHNHKEIAKQLLNTKYDLFLGGGAKHFKGEDLSKFAVVRNRREFNSVKAKKPILGLFAEKHFPYVQGRGKQVPSLTEMVAFAIKRLKARGDFFLLVEGGRIDHAGHNNEFKTGMGELLEFDRAIGEATKLVSKKDTLILVTSDHETGGLTLPRENKTKLRPLFSTQKHTATDVPTYGWGVEAQSIRGTLDNTQLFPILRRVLTR